MNKSNKVSVVVTVKNDDVGVKALQEDLEKQTRKPDEIIIIHAEDYQNCTRAEGRNIGIKKAKYDVIAVTDVGCRPHKDWLEKLVTPIEKGTADVVAGFYHVIAHSPFQQAVSPYLAVSPDRINTRYLPASRSVAFTKKAWELVGGYPVEAISAGEDLEFSRRLSKHPLINIVQAPQAIVDWEPPETLTEYFLSIRNHTKGNFEARIWPHIFRNITVFLRWVLFLFIPTLVPFYLFWPIVKRDLALQGQSSRGLSLSRWKAILLLPIIQLVTDAAILVTLLHPETYSGFRKRKQV